MKELDGEAILRINEENHERNRSELGKKQQTRQINEQEISSTYTLFCNMSLFRSF